MRRSRPRPEGRAAALREAAPVRLRGRCDAPSGPCGGSGASLRPSVLHSFARDGDPSGDHTKVGSEGIALTAQWASNHDDGMKKRASDALGKADQQAKAEGNEALSLQIESFVKKNLNAAPAGGAPEAGRY